MRIHSPHELKAHGRGICAAIGFFDGVHLGHQEILRQTVADARQCGGIAVAITFDAHPTTILAPSRVPKLIYQLQKKLAVIESLGIDHVLLYHFDHKFSEQPGEAFVRSLVIGLHGFRSLCVGAHFSFGHQRSGNVSLLRHLGAELKFEVHGLPSVAVDGKTVSSTRIREAIHAGELELAGRLLGRTYSLSGKVVEGDGLGRKLGFPTANLETAGLALPPKGVYAAQTEINGRQYQAVLNIGVRPTIHQPKPQLRVEVHVLDFEGSLYGNDMELENFSRIRDEQKFGSVEQLQLQIAKDISVARASR
jgi:riboflavin kinase/FMN adenylyltransferase